MPQFSTPILETRLEIPGQPGAVIAMPPKLALLPGQFLLAHVPTLAEILPTPLFPARQSGDRLELAPPLPPGWEAGVTLSVKGPFGNGFHRPPLAQRVLLVSFLPAPHRLLPLAQSAHAAGAAVALFANAIPVNLPEEFELLTDNDLPAAIAWADYLALDLTLEQVPGLLDHLGVESLRCLPGTAEALILTPLPCAGLAECSLCAVQTKSGWRRACEDGPVFDLREIDL